MHTLNVSLYDRKFLIMLKLGSDQSLKIIKIVHFADDVQIAIFYLNIERNRPDKDRLVVSQLLH
ncbi:hypothetical protein D3C81_2243490 [compost metagenome]